MDPPRARPIRAQAGEERPRRGQRADWRIRLSLTPQLHGTIGQTGLEALYDGVLERIHLFDIRYSKGDERTADEVTFQSLRQLHRYPRLKNFEI